MWHLPGARAKRPPSRASAFRAKDSFASETAECFYVASEASFEPLTMIEAIVPTAAAGAVVVAESEGVVSTVCRTHRLGEEAGALPDGCSRIPGARGATGWLPERIK